MAASKWRTTLYLPKEYEAKIKQWAKDEDRSVNNLISTVIKQAVDERSANLPVQSHSLPSFVQLLAGKNISSIVQIAQIPNERVSAIANGERPTNEELIGLSRALGMTSDELKTIRKYYFNGNGIKERV